MSSAVFNADSTKGIRLQALPHAAVRSLHVDGRKALNAMDEAMLAVNQSLQALGGVGFETQTVVWTHERVNVAMLRDAIARLSRRYPVLCGRLVHRSWMRGRFWQYRPDACCKLVERTLPSSDSTAVLALSAKLLSEPHDLQHEDPVRFHLAHLPDGRDLFLMQYNHTLMDHTAAGIALQELGMAADGRAATLSTADSESLDLIRGYLSRFSFMRRLTAACRSWDHRMRRLHGPVAALTQREPVPAAFRVQVIRRVLDSAQTRQAVTSIVAGSGFPGVSMSILGCAFRAIQHLSGGRRCSKGRYVAGIGLDLGSRKSGRPIFQNGVSLVPVHADAANLSERDALARMLNAQFRDHLARDLDLGVLQLATTFRRCRRYVHHSTKRLMRDGYSLWYAYFGRLDAIGERFCGAAIEDIAVVGPAWPGPGLTLLVNQYRGRLLFQATFMPDLIEPHLFEEFLSFLIADLANS